MPRSRMVCAAVVMVFTAARASSARNGNVSGARQVRSEERNLKQSAFRQKTELYRECLRARPAYPCSSGDWRRRRSFRPVRFCPALRLSPSLRCPATASAPTRAPPRFACGRWFRRERSTRLTSPKPMVARDDERSGDEIGPEKRHWFYFTGSVLPAAREPRRPNKANRR